MRQSDTRKTRLLPYRSHMKTMVKKVMNFAQEGKKAEAEKALPIAFKAVDTAVKKNILLRATGNRRKSLLSRTVAAIGK